MLWGFLVTRAETFPPLSCLVMPTVGKASLTHQPLQRGTVMEDCAFPSDFLNLQPSHFIWEEMGGDLSG